MSDWPSPSLHQTAKLLVMKLSDRFPFFKQRAGGYIAMSQNAEFIEIFEQDAGKPGLIVTVKHGPRVQRLVQSLAEELMHKNFGAYTYTLIENTDNFRRAKFEYHGWTIDAETTLLHKLRCETPGVQALSPMV